MTNQKSVFAVIGLCALGACGGTTNGNVLDEQLEFATESEIAAERADYVDDFGDDIRDPDGAGPLTPNYVDPSEFAATGSAVFDGLIGIGEVQSGQSIERLEEADLVSRVRFELDLEQDSIEGVANSFVRQDDQVELTGELNFSGVFLRGAVAQDRFGASGDLNGSLTDPDGFVSNVDGDFRGDFFGTGGQAFDADADGSITVTPPAGSSTTQEVLVFDADIIARRAD